MSDEIMENENQVVPNREIGAEERETGKEMREEQENGFIRGAEMLEEPQDGSFVSGLQAFVAWVKSLVAPNDKP